MIKPEYRGIASIEGSLLVIEGANASYNELVKIRLDDGREVIGQVIEVSEKYSVVEIFGPSLGFGRENIGVVFTGDTFKFSVGKDMIGRVFNGKGEPIDVDLPIKEEERLDINGLPINPYARDLPNDFIETGISAIDGLNTLVMGQKLPLFSGSGLPHNEIVAQIIRQASIPGKEADFLIIFAGIGITYDTYLYFMKEFNKTNASSKLISFVNFASDPSIERIVTPRLALTTAEYFAYKEDMHVLVILDDMTNYGEALRELSSAREEVPGRRGYPGYMYTDLASLFERAGKIKNKKGDITQLNVVTLPGDDITHPIPDLTGYITEGQILLSRELFNKGIYPPITPIGSLSRLMNNGIGNGKTRADHRQVADQLYSAYSLSLNARMLSSIIGKDSLSDIEKLYLDFGEQFEKKFINQGRDERRDIEKTLDIGWELLSLLPESELTRVKQEFIDKYYKVKKS